MFHAIRSVLTNPLLVVPVLLAAAVALVLGGGVLVPGHERPIDRGLAPTADVELMVERGWFGGPVSALEITVVNRGAEPYALNAGGGLVLQDDRGNRYAARPPADDPELVVPAHAIQRSHVLFVGPLDPGARTVTLLLPEGHALAGLPVARTGRLPGAPMPEASRVVERIVDRTGRLEAELGASEAARVALEERAAGLDARIAELDSERAALEVELEAREEAVHGRLRELGEAMADSSARLAELGEEVASLSLRIEDLLAVRALAEGTVVELEAELAALREQAEAETTRLARELDVARSRAEGLAAELAEEEELQAHAEALEGELAETRARIAELEEALTASEAEQQRLADELEVARAGFAEREQALHAALSEAEAELEAALARLDALEAD